MTVLELPASVVREARHEREGLDIERIDGVVVIPKNKIDYVYTSALKIIKREETILNEIRNGKSTCDIFNIPANILHTSFSKCVYWLFIFN